MKHPMLSDLVIDAQALLEYYAWAARKGLTAKDRRRIREAARVMHRLRMEAKDAPLAHAEAARSPCELGGDR